MNYRQAYDFGAAFLQESKIQEAELDARLLLEWICHTNRNDLYAHGDKEITGQEKENFLDALKKRSEHMPLQYIIGVQEFMGLSFTVNENVLIPRQDTEILVEAAMTFLHDGMSILDICTGSGCILLSLLHYKNDCYGVGVDISEEALLVARQNAEALGECAAFMQSDLLEKVQEKFDVIVSNPPYIKSGVIGTLMEEVKNYEPQIALDGKEDGLYFYRKIIGQVKKNLNKGGTLLFEIGYDQGNEVRELMLDAGFCDVKVVKDLAGLNRVVVGSFLDGGRYV